jgi:hypothetical protein
MFFLQRSPDYLADIERTGAEALARGRAKEADVERHRDRALSELKQLAVQKAIIIGRLQRSSNLDGPRLDDPVFKRKVQDTAAALLFQSHLHFSTDG